MDKAEAYRIIGVRDDAAYEQIRFAYEYRLKKLNSADYDDERAYARRKSAELKEAYSIVTGQNAPNDSKFKIGLDLDVDDIFGQHDGECDHEQEAEGGKANISFHKRPDNSDTIIGLLRNNAGNASPDASKKALITIFGVIFVLALLIEVLGILI